MHFEVLTLFPEMIENTFMTGITGRACLEGIVSLNTVNIRDYAVNDYGSVDDYTYGGGAGMLMMCEPVYNAFLKAKENTGNKAERVIYLTPQGERFTQRHAKEFSGEEALILLCGHYEGIDERVLSKIVTDNISVGDYVLTGGELPALIVMDAVTRLIPGALGNGASPEDESFSDGLLEYPQYTRPGVWKDMEVPQILMSGDHKKVGQYRVREARKRTMERRPEMYEEYLRKRGIY
ncbi:MAG: tRNA (guanosine(37)-N1)-methyltransferase TrmD [Lachnospiraceae bacterium]|nr:tRNA (guanosine(37)-N1)-methyltransferase TrmD [Lachnospiraceae bacterium]MBR1876149.1 tRNA (guanosine(37)-N1)-methyltransferase TrmD [Lachnospiraceae bacterium]